MNFAVLSRIARIALPAFGSLTALSLAACTGAAPTLPPTPTTRSQVETQPVSLPSTATAETNQSLTFMASDASLDCFSGSGEADDCEGVDLLGVVVGLQDQVLDEPNDPRLPVVFLVAFRDRPDSTPGFDLHIYLDVDQDPTTGFDMSDGATPLPGIDRLIRVALPQGESWTQNVANGGYDAEIVHDERVSAQVIGENVVVLVGRAILDERAPMAAGQHAPLAHGSVAQVERALLAGGAPDSFTLYIGTARGSGSLDYFNGSQDIHVPLPMTVPQEVMYPPNAGGGS